MPTGQPLIFDRAAAQPGIQLRGTLPGGARSCRELVGMGCPHPYRATACEGEFKT